MKRLILYCGFLLACGSAVAQPGDDGANSRRGEKIRALYVAYISQQLQFTPQEAQRFWPLHAQFESEMMDINRSNLSPLDKQQRMLDLKRKYQPQFESVIGRDRSNRFYLQNDQFRDKLLEVRQQHLERKEMKTEGGEFRPRMYNGGGMKRQSLLMK